MYGLIEGGSEIDVARCDELLECGAARGIVPSRKTVALAIAIVRGIQLTGKNTALLLAGLLIAVFNQSFSQVGQLVLLCGLCAALFDARVFAKCRAPILWVR